MTPQDEGRDDRGDGRNGQDASDLRRRAEARMPEDPGAVPADLEGLSLDQVRGMLHDLKVHQIELEMQNEELRRSRAELEGSHERYFDLFDLAPVGYFTLTESGLILEANLTGGELLGVPRNDLMERSFTEFILADDQDGYYHHRRAVTLAGAPATCELRMVRSDGSTFHALLESAPSLPVDDHATIRTVVSDITQRTRAAAERLLLEKRLQQVEKVESLGRMAGAMAHHFNNLLGVTTGNLELVLEKASQGSAWSISEAVGDLQDALAGARKATDLTQLLLAYLGQARSEPVLADLSKIVRRGTSLLEIAMPLGTKFTTDLPSRGPSVRVDPREIQQLVTNLVTNAWEASEPGSASVHLSVSTVRASQIPEEDRFPAGWRPTAQAYACIQVRDEGPGIEPGKLDEIFDPFYSSKSFGRGLGLSVALGTARAHDGAIAVTTRPGEGAGFMVYLPAAGTPAVPGEEDGIPSRAAREVSAGPGSMDRSLAREDHPEGLEGGETAVGDVTVLVVEDNEMVKKLAVRILGQMGFAVLEAADGMEALEVFGEHRDRIQVVLCDVTMPRMGGWETLTALRHVDPDIPVILTSGYAEAIATAGNHPEQPDAFLDKPWNLEELRKVLVKAVGGLDGSPELTRWK